MYVCVYLSIYLSSYLSSYLSICLSIDLSIYLYLSIVIYLSLSIQLSIYLSICMVACFFSVVGKECGFQISSRKRDARLFCSPYAYQGSGLQQVSTSRTCQTGPLTYYDGRWHPYLLDIDMHRRFFTLATKQQKIYQMHPICFCRARNPINGRKFKELDCQTESAWSGDPETFDGFNCCGKCAGRFENLGADCSKPEVEEWVAGFICYYLNLSLDHGMSNVKLEYRPLQSICKASAFSLAQFCPDILAVARLGHHKSFDRMWSR